MISEHMKKDIKAVVEKETFWACEQHGNFKSRHEGWAVALEELEEFKESAESMSRHFDNLWVDIKGDERTLGEIGMTLDRAYNAIAELIQFTAMLEKMNIYENWEEHKNRGLSFLQKNFNITFPAREREKKTCEKCKHYTDAPEDLGHCDKCVITLDGTVTEFTPKPLKEQLEDAIETLKKDKEAKETLKPEEPIKAKVTEKPPFGAYACKSCKHLNGWRGDTSCKKCTAEYIFDRGNVASEWEPAVEITEEAQKCE